jgi:hypothetical protein
MVWTLQLNQLANMWGPCIGLASPFAIAVTTGGPQTHWRQSAHTKAERCVNHLLQRSVFNQHARRLHPSSSPGSNIRTQVLKGMAFGQLPALTCMLKSRPPSLDEPSASTTAVHNARALCSWVCVKGFAAKLAIAVAVYRCAMLQQQPERAGPAPLTAVSNALLVGNAP